MKNQFWECQSPQTIAVQRAWLDFVTSNPNSSKLEEVIRNNPNWRERAAEELLSHNNISDQSLRCIIVNVPEWRKKATRILLQRIKWNLDAINSSF